MRAKLKDNVFDTYAQMGISIENLLKAKAIGNTGIREQLIEGFGENMTVDSYEQASYIYGVLKDLFGKDRFTAKENADSSVEYTNTVQGKDILAALMKHADVKELLTSLATEDEMMKMLKDTSVVLSFTEKKNTVVKNTMDIKAVTKPFTLAFTVNCDQQGNSVFIDVQVPEVAKATLTENARVTRSSAKVDTKIPADEVVIDINDLANGAAMTDDMEEAAVEEAPAAEAEEAPEAEEAA